MKGSLIIQSTIASLFLLIICAAGAFPSPSPTPPLTPVVEYSLYKSIPLNDYFGFTGRLDIYQDASMTSKEREAKWGAGFLNQPKWGNAYLLLIDKEGAVVDRQDLDAPEVMAKEVFGTHGYKLWSISVDHTVGMSTYNGIGTTFLDVKEGKIGRIKAANVSSGEQKIIGLPRTRKADYRIVTPWAKEDEMEILVVSCLPNYNDKTKDVDFTVRYTRYLCRNGKWTERFISRSGFWESDAPFPVRFMFPSNK